MTEDTPEIGRIDQLPDEIITNLGYVALNHDIFDHEARQALYASIPKKLTPEEVDSLGLAVNSHAELTAPSKLGNAHGQKSEVGAIAFVGIMAFSRSEDETLDSVIKHLKRKRGLGGKIAALTLSNHRRTIVADFMPFLSRHRSKDETDTAVEADSLQTP